MLLHRFREVNWINVAWFTIIHVLCVVALVIVPSYLGFYLCVALGFVTGGLGICVGYHRHFTHKSFETYPLIRWLLAVLGTLGAQGSLLRWVADHRKHHAHSDKEGDPHSPLKYPHNPLLGAWWSHMGWMLRKKSKQEYDDLIRTRVPLALRQDPVICFLDRNFLYCQFLLAATLFGVGIPWGLYTAFSCLLWGMSVRMVYVFHSTWAVNSLSHMIGYCNYDTPDKSRNNWLVALFSYGEGWHNNHHKFPDAANHGHRLWEIDIAYWVIRGLEVTRLAWGVKRVTWDVKRASV